MKTRMTKPEIRMNDEARMTSGGRSLVIRHSSFGIDSSFWFRHSSFARTRAFTLIEVLAALMLIAIALPAVMQAVTVSTSAGAVARRRTEAAGLAESKLAEIVATDQWQSVATLSGDFGTDWPDYKWQATIGPWSGDTTSTSLQQIDLRVTWLSRGREDSLTVSTLAYDRSSLGQ